MANTLIGMQECERMSLIQLIMPVTEGSKKLATCSLRCLIVLTLRTKLIRNTCPLSLIVPALISMFGSFSLLPNLMKYGFEESLKDICVTLSKYLVIVAISSGSPYLDPNNFSKPVRVISVRQKLVLTCQELGSTFCYSRPRSLCFHS